MQEEVKKPINNVSFFKNMSEKMSEVYNDFDGTLKDVLIAYVLQGHVLLEGPPGTAKTLMAKHVSELLAKKFTRVQFTSDLLPQDLLGVHVYKNQNFEFFPGPIFSDIVLADEINRSSPRTQSALLEAMEEKQVSIEGKRLALSPDFFVIATQNPQDYEGTFPLPEVQLDRFMLCLQKNHAPKDVEINIMQQVLRQDSDTLHVEKNVTLQALNVNISDVRKAIDAVEVNPAIYSYVADILQAFRASNLVEHGPSIRSGLALLKCSKARSMMEQRSFVTPDDVKHYVHKVLFHRIKRSSEALLHDLSQNECIDTILDAVSFPQ